MGIAFLASAVLGPLLIPVLTRMKAGQVIRSDGPARHLGKAGTPTMGGILIISAIILASLVMAGHSREVILCLGATVAFGLIGFWDDYIKVVLRRSLGLRAREKLVMQVFFALIFGIYVVFGLFRGTDVIVPFAGYDITLGYWYFPFVVLVFLATTNAVNLTDGLDGLAAGTTFFVALGLIIICFMTTHTTLAVFAASLAGACLGFLIYNRHPARVFMGDTGSMALGAAVASMAALTRSELALIVVGGVYVLEALSVILQVISFQVTGKRIFLMSPLHHHFELKGWGEKFVVRVFWLVSLLFVILGLWGFRGIGAS
ncbi:MAG: phospho-N-acetylmuramoyl-pentapeptide-transferase [Bacillota bacterium]